VNQFINELSVIQPKNKGGQERVLSTKAHIQWIGVSNKDVLNVSVPTLDDIFDYQLANHRTELPVANVAIGTKIQERKCEKIFTCYKVDKEDFWRNTEIQSAGISQ
jgi:hypothetical protein